MFSTGTDLRIRDIGIKIRNTAHTQAVNLKLHLHTHTGEKPHHCALCTKSFVTAAHMRQHVKSAHPEEKPPPLLMSSSSAAGLPPSMMPPPTPQALSAAAAVAEASYNDLDFDDDDDDDMASGHRDNRHRMDQWEMATHQLDHLN